MIWEFMSDRGILFIFSCVVIVGSLAAAGWLAASGQASSVDGLFLLLTCLLTALAFGLYLVFLIRRTLESLQAPPPPQVKPTTAAQKAPAPAAQTQTKTQTQTT